MTVWIGFKAAFSKEDLTRVKSLLPCIEESSLANQQ